MDRTPSDGHTVGTRASSPSRRAVDCYVRTLIVVRGSHPYNLGCVLRYGRSYSEKGVLRYCYSSS